MGNKSFFISKLMFIISFALFLLFAATIVFVGPKVGGAIYFIFFAMFVAFACIDRKMNANFFEYYKYAIYLDDLVNILAIGSLIYFKKDVIFMIVILSLIGVGLFIDLIFQTNHAKRKFESIAVTVFNCVLMLSIFPYFFLNNLSIAVPIVAVVVAAIVTTFKIVLAVVPVKNKNIEEVSDKTTELEKIESEISNENENAVE